jgi:hypothetical protein
LVLDRVAFLHHALCALLVAPEIRVLGPCVEFVQPLARLVDVKDASSAARQTA